MANARASASKPDRDTAGFFDAGMWGEAKKKGDVAIKKMIDDALELALVRSRGYDLEGPAPDRH